MSKNTVKDLNFNQALEEVTEKQKQEQKNKQSLENTWRLVTSYFNEFKRDLRFNQYNLTDIEEKALKVIKQIKEAQNKDFKNQWLNYLQQEIDAIKLKIDEPNEPALLQSPSIRVNKKELFRKSIEGLQQFKSELKKSINLDSFNLKSLAELKRQLEGNKKFFHNLTFYEDMHEMVESAQEVEYKDFKEIFNPTDKPKVKFTVDSADVGLEEPEKPSRRLGA